MAFNLKLVNPWIAAPSIPILSKQEFIPRVQVDELIDAERDQWWTLLVGPRRAGKSTLGKYVADCGQ